jgi:RNA polymerase sigma-70 factor (ECF subfamily)
MTQVETFLTDHMDMRGHGGEGPTITSESSGAAGEDRELIVRLRARDEAAFTSLVDRYHVSLIRLAMSHVSDRSVAEEVVQESWLGVLEGLDGFEGRSSLKTWIFRIVANKAKTRGVRESRHTSFSEFGTGEAESEEAAVDPSHFRTSGHWVDYWAAYPQPWDENTPERLSLSKEGAAHLKRAISALPSNLGQVLILRDVEGLSSKEVCDMLAVSEANQRVLLHRARSRVRRALEQYIGGNRQA